VEKLVYPLWRQPQLPADRFRDELLAQLAPRLGQLAAVRGIRLAVADSAVASAAGRCIESHPPGPSALLSLWVDYAGAARSWEPLIEEQVEHSTGYLVVEAEPLVSQSTRPVQPGEHIPGMCQVALLRKPAGLARHEWLEIWQGSHTRIAIDTQATFGYRQNLVVRPLGGAVPSVDAIVEENFPAEAMASDHAFYATGGDEALLTRRMTTLLESCARFIDFEHIDVVPMSEYLIKPLAAP